VRGVLVESMLLGEGSWGLRYGMRQAGRLRLERSLCVPGERKVLRHFRGASTEMMGAIGITVEVAVAIVNIVEK
jgi:hypothetical protein